MSGNIELKCACGKLTEINVSEEMNHKDIIYCDCGRNFLIVEIIS